MQTLYTAIDRLLLIKPYAAIAIDGPCCAGKSGLAAALCARYSGAVVHMDDFFLPIELRTESRLMTPGGNIHHERFLQEAAPGIREKTAFAYRPFDCARMAYSAPKKVPRAPLTIVEGSYSMHPALISIYDICVFLEITASEQRRRLFERESEEKAARFLSEWIPMENSYLDAFDIRSRADIRLST